MTWYLTKLAITAALIVSISEVSKMSSFVGALLASVPLVSVLAMCWIYFETKDIEQISSLTTSIFWLVLPSLSFFVVLPILLKAQVPFSISMVIGLVVMIGCYFATVFLLGKLGANL
ncbi:MAG: DUF3147 family protein [Gammaproteobacteria bacterium]|nr:DUF3147 family protein [Gammaproteobacteria bacterium]